MSDEDYLYVSSERTVYRVMEEIGISHRQKRKPNGITKADNAHCESMWARLKEELLYHRYDASKMKVETVRTLIWRYFISYWNNRRICSTNGGLPPMVKRHQYYISLQDAA